MPTKANPRRWSLRRSDGSFPGIWPGACCKNDGTCEILTEDECNALAGSVYRSDDTLCADVECDPAGACCTGTDCNQYTEAYCAELSGTYHGDGVECADPSCTDSTLCITTGSCCYYKRNTGPYGCYNCKTQQECTDLSDDGIFCDLVWTADTDCNDVDCNAIGRCCHYISGWHSECTNNTEVECIALGYSDWDSDKACDTCETPTEDTCPTGRCCVAADDGSYSECKSGVTEITCEARGDLADHESNWVVDGECNGGDNPCGFGLCCTTAGVCKGPVLESQCDGTFSGNENSTCRTDCNECVDIACCHGENCSMQTECECDDGGGTNTGESDCVGVGGCDRCDFGACCEGENCTLKNECECNDAGGDFFADESDCGTDCNRCDFGICCVGEHCFPDVRSECDCSSGGGVFLADESDCGVGCNRCITGACCNGSDCEPDIRECDCSSTHTFHANTSCSPNPCDPWGVCCINGVCNDMTLSACDAAEGTHHAGESCEGNQQYDCTNDPCSNVSGTCCTDWQNSPGMPYFYVCCTEWTNYNYECDGIENCEECRASAEASIGCEMCGPNGDWPCEDCPDGGGI